MMKNLQAFALICLACLSATGYADVLHLKSGNTIAVKSVAPQGSNYVCRISSAGGSITYTKLIATGDVVRIEKAADQPRREATQPPSAPSANTGSGRLSQSGQARYEDTLVMKNGTVLTGRVHRVNWYTVSLRSASGDRSFHFSELSPEQADRLSTYEEFLRLEKRVRLPYSKCLKLYGRPEYERDYNVSTSARYMEALFKWQSYDVSVVYLSLERDQSIPWNLQRRRDSSVTSVKYVLQHGARFNQDQQEKLLNLHADGHSWRQTEDGSDNHVEWVRSDDQWRAWYDTGFTVTGCLPPNEFMIFDNPGFYVTFERFTK